jgi:hypothetical protein
MTKICSLYAHKNGVGAPLHKIINDKCIGKYCVVFCANCQLIISQWIWYLYTRIGPIY